jgi:hypothetical protein
MTKVNWAVDGNILDSRSTVGDLAQAIRDAGHNLNLAKYIPFASSDEQDYGPKEWDDEPTILYGSHGYLRKCKRPFNPGAYGLNNNMMCNVYYSYIPEEWMLNGQFIMLPFEHIKRNFEAILNLFDDDKVFVRPNSGFKTFTGMVLTYENYRHELSASQQLTSVIPETICMVAEAKPLKAEFRFLVVDGDVVDGSEYRWDNVLDIRHDYDADCFKLAQRMSAHSWQPDSIYTCDVALTEQGPKIIELNSFACAGLYALDKNIVVNRVSEFAYKEFHG